MSQDMAKIDIELEESSKAFFAEAQKVYPELKDLEFSSQNLGLANLLFNNTTAHRRELDAYVKGKITESDLIANNIERGLKVYEFLKVTTSM